MDETLPNAGHRALAALERAGAVSGVITQNVDLLHEGGQPQCRQLARHLCRSDLPGLRTHHDPPRSPDMEAANPGFVERAEAVGGIAVAPDADAVVGDYVCVHNHRLHHLRRHAQAQHRLLRRKCAEDRVAQAYAMVDGADALLVAGSSLTVFNPLRAPRRWRSACPSRSSTRPYSRGRSGRREDRGRAAPPMLALLADELPVVMSA